MENLEEKILVELDSLRPKKTGGHWIMECPSCHENTAFCYLLAGYYSRIICNRKNKCRHNRAVWEVIGKSSEELPPNSGYLNGVQGYFLDHALDIGLLIQSGFLNESIPKLKIGVVDGKEYWRELRFKKEDQRYRWFHTGGMNAGVLEFYPVLQPHGSILYVMEGDADWMKGCTDGLSCTASLFGAGYIPKFEKAWNTLLPWEEIRIVAHCDSAGLNGASKLAKAILEKFPNKTVSIIKLPFEEAVTLTLPSGKGIKPKDYCDFRINHTMEDFWGLQPIDIVVKKSKREKKMTSQDYLAWLSEMGYRFTLNELNDKVYINGTRLTDVERACIKSKMIDRSIEKDRNVYIEHLDSTIIAEAYSNKFNPITDYFSQLGKWDGQDYLGILLAHFQGEEHIRRWFEIWLSRCYLKATQQTDFNPTLILKGPQGIGKSALCLWLCPEPLRRDHYHDGQFNFDDKDCLGRQAEILVWEHQEAGFAKKDINALKDFLTKKSIRWRPAFGREDVEKPARTSFIFTVNETGGFLVDDENRRFHTVTIHSIGWGYQKIQCLNENLWRQVKAQAQAWSPITQDDLKIRDARNEDEKIVSPIEIILEKVIEKTDDDSFVDLDRIVQKLSDNQIKPSRQVTMEIAQFMAKIDVKKDRSYIQKGPKSIRVRGYRGISLQ